MTTACWLSKRFWKREEVGIAVGFVCCGIVAAWLVGRHQPHYVPDSPSYLDYPLTSLDAMCRSIRTPGYPLWLAIWRMTFGIDFVPLAQVVVHQIASAWLVIELRRLGMSLSSALVAGIAVAVGATAMDHVHTISTDSLAASLGVMVVCSLLRWSDRSTTFLIHAVVTSLLAMVAIMVRPAYLFLIPWLLIAGTLLGQLFSGSWSVSLRRAALTTAMTLIPLLFWMTLRLWSVGDFGMLPFGHQNLGAVLVQLVSDSELQSLPGDAGKLGEAVVAEKSNFVRGGGEFFSGDPLATMTIDARWDDMTYYVLVPAAQRLCDDDDTIAQHNLIAEMNRQIIRRYPVRYLIWIAKNLRRGAWAIAANIVMHPLFLLAIAATIGWVLTASVIGTQWGNASENTVSMRAFTIVALTYLLFNLGFIALTSPAIGRFSDAAAILLPSWIGVVVWRTARKGR